MSVTLKRLVGNAGAGADDSHGTDTLYAVLAAIVTTQNDLIAQFNTLKGEYDAETNASHVDSAATDVVVGVEIE